MFFVWVLIGTSGNVKHAKQKDQEKSVYRISYFFLLLKDTFSELVPDSVFFCHTAVDVAGSTVVLYYTNRTSEFTLSAKRLLHFNTESDKVVFAALSVSFCTGT